jgi:protein ImuB
MNPRPHWLALRPDDSPPEDGSPALPALRQQALAWWALQFTPRVCLREEAVLLELQASLRLFGGLRALHQRIAREGAPLGLGDMAWAPTPLAALALARQGLCDGLRPPLAPLLDALPLAALSAAHAQQPMLARLGCTRLGQLRQLPRAALGRRFGTALLLALDQAYGEAQEAPAWISLPERFQARLELPYRIEHAGALLHHAQGLLAQLCGWLAARQAGVCRLRLHWLHDSLRAREAGPGGELGLATAEPTRDMGHLGRLLGERLLRLSLAAPVGELRLEAGEILPLAPPNASLLARSDDAPQAREPLHQLLERLSLRLGEQRVRGVRLQPDHRLDAMQQWQPWQPAPRARARGRRAVMEAMGAMGAMSATGSADATQPPRPSPPPSPLFDGPAGPQPTWLLDPPQRLATQQDRPLYQGPLQQLAGPQRIESGWWDRATPGQQRDYYLFRSERAGLLWIFHGRLSGPGEADAGWFLHGVFG